MLDSLVSRAHELNQVSLIGAMALGMVFEMLAPLRQVSKVPLGRWCNNLLLTILNYALLMMLGPLLLGAAYALFGTEPKGLLAYIGASWWLSLLLVFLVLEFVTYWVHRASHSWAWLWRLHAVHHTDTEQDVTTTWRHHPLSFLLSSLTTLPILIMLGPDLSVLVIYNVLHALIATLSHANVSLGTTFNRMLGWFLVTPDFHRIHHSVDPRYTNSNYGTLCSLYDYIFGTTQHWTRQQHLTESIGLEYCREPKDSRLDQLLILPARSVFTT